MGMGAFPCTDRAVDAGAENAGNDSEAKSKNVRALIVLFNHQNATNSNSFFIVSHTPYIIKIFWENTPLIFCIR